MQSQFHGRENSPPTVLLKLIRPTSLFSKHIPHQQQSEREQLIDVNVGTGDKSKVFQVAKTSVCIHSQYFFESRCTASYVLDEHDPIAFELFCQWIGEPANPILYSPGAYSEEPWISNAAAAWILADELRAPEFQKYALSQFIQNCALMAFGPWEFVERVCLPESPIRCFSNHWVAWNYVLAGTSRPNEYSGLHAAVLARLVTDKTRDPRIYDLDHWYSECAREIGGSDCSHDPILRLQRERKATVSAEAAVLEAEWGRYYELSRQNDPSYTGIFSQH